MSGEERVCAALFDFDGTLAEIKIDFSLMRKRVLDALERLGVARALLRGRYVLELIEEGARLLQSEDLERELRTETARIMEEIEMEATNGASAFPWVERMALELAENDISAAIVTRNCRRAVTKVLGPWLGLFQILVTRDEIRTVKPNPQHLLRALSLLPGIEVPPERAVMVGDHPMDVQCAKQAGMFAVGVMTGAGSLETLSKEGADLILPDASQLPIFIRLLNSGKARWLERQ